MPLNKNQKKQFNMVCERIAGGESLRTICKDKDMPTARGVLKWLNADGNDAAVQQYAQAREDQADFHADEIIAIADSEPDAARARVRVDARRWVASKLRPKRYGERVQHSGDSDNPIRHQVIEWVSVKAD